MNWKWNFTLCKNDNKSLFKEFIIFYFQIHKNTICYIVNILILYNLDFQSVEATSKK